MLAQVCQENINRLLLGERNAVSFGLSDHLMATYCGKKSLLPSKSVHGRAAREAL